MNDQSEENIIIISKQFLFRFGTRSLLGFISSDFSLSEAQSLDEAFEHLNKSPHFNYIIASDDVFSELYKNEIDRLLVLQPYCKIMILSKTISFTHPSISIVDSSDNQKELLEKLETFFKPDEEPLKISGSEPNILSDREIDILKTVAMGLSNKEIADQLYISINTVITHRKNITEKLGIKTIAGLTVFAILNNYIKPEDVKV